MSLETCKPEARESSWKGSIRNPSQAEDLALFHRSLGELCRSGMPLSKALRCIATEFESGSLGVTATEMADEVEKGCSLVEAYECRTSAFPPLYRSLLEAGIAAGDLPGILDEIAEHASQRARVAQKMRKALAYPMLAGSFVGIAGLTLLVFMPNVSYPFWNGGIPPANGTTSIPGNWIHYFLQAGLVLLFCGIIFGFAWLRNPLDGRIGPEKIRNKIPFLGRLRLYAAKASFATTMALLARRRLPLERALALAQAASDDSEVRQQIERMRESASSGAGLSESVRSGDLIPPSLLSLVEAAEKSGTAHEALADLADIYHRRLDRALERFTILARPLSEVLVGLIVMGFVISYVFPAFSYMRAIFGWH